MARESMDQFNIEEGKKEAIEQLRRKIEEMIEKERDFQKKNEPFNGHLIPINPSELTKEDLMMFKKHQDDTWTYAEWKVFTDSVSADIKREPDNKANNSRDNFRDYLAERAQFQFGREEAEERKVRENQ